MGVNPHALYRDLQTGEVNVFAFPLGSVYTGPGLFGTGTKLVRISLVFTRDLVDPVRTGSAIWYEIGMWKRTVPV